MTTAVATKVMVPSQPHGAVKRERLLDRLDEAVAGPLTLVVAAAGTGKTVLLSSWAASGRAPGPVAWVALDAGDAHRRRFWRVVLQALKAAGVGGPVESLEVPVRAPVEAFVPALVDALAERDQPVVLVLDDFHEVAGTVAPAIEPVLRHPSANLRLVLASRVDPPLRLGRLRLAGGVTDLHAAELACTVGEAGALLEGLAEPVGDDGVRRLWAHTEGWPAGLRLAAASLRSHPDGRRFINEFTGEDRAVSDYLVSEVLAAQPLERRQFLLRTSVVDTLDGELAEVLSGSADGAEVLSQLERAGVPAAAVDNRGHWYRYHALFAEFLRARLRLELPGEVPKLHARAAEVFAARGHNALALRHAVEGQVWSLAARLVADQGVRLILRGSIETAAPMVVSLPPDEQERHPELGLGLAALLLEREDRAGAEMALERALAEGGRLAPSSELMLTLVKLQLARMDRDFPQVSALAEELLDRSDAAHETIAAELRSFALANVGIAALWMGDLGVATRTLEQSLAAAHHAESDWPSMVASSYLALAADLTGDAEAMDRHAGEAIAIAQRRGWMDTWPASPALQMRAYAAAQRLDLDEAERLLALAKRALHSNRESLLWLTGRTIRGLILEARGRLRDALDEIRAAREGARMLPAGHPLLAGLQQLEARLLISQGELELAREALRPMGENGGANPGVLAERARIDLLEGNPAAACKTVAPALNGNEPGIAHLPAHAWLVEALARDAQDELPAADFAVARAVDILASAGMLRSLTLYGPSLSPLLERQLAGGSAHSALLGQALAVLESHPADGQAEGAAPEEPLTDRELQVLVYLPTMLTMPEIADELALSQNTVRTHLKAIYRKLKAHRRTEAVDRARRLQLLDKN